jgi:uncharacterized RDD family membrane protein YckC
VTEEYPLTPTVAPTLKRRMICMLYEGILLFGVVFAADLIFDILTQSRHALTLRHVRSLWLFLTIGLYFVFFWSRSGQTLAMKTWGIRLIDNEKQRLPVIKAIVRYCLAWMWFLPGLAIAAQFGLKNWTSLGVVAAGFILWSLTAFFDKDRQFLHDRLAKTRLIDVKANLSVVANAAASNKTS